MASKIEWTAVDYAARDVIAQMLDTVNLSYREIEDRLHGQMSYNRVRDLRLGRRAPVRLSEFLALCKLCRFSLRSAVDEVVSRADAIEKAENNAALESNEDDPQYIADHLDQFDYAAKHGDTEAEQEAYEEMP